MKTKKKDDTPLKRKKAYHPIQIQEHPGPTPDLKIHRKPDTGPATDSSQPWLSQINKRYRPEDDDDNN